MHRTRDLLVKQRTQLINMIRGLLAEFGVDIPKGLERALLMARQIVMGAAKIVATLSESDEHRNDRTRRSALTIRHRLCLSVRIAAALVSLNGHMKIRRQPNFVDSFS
jgi:transposase